MDIATKLTNQFIEFELTINMLKKKKLMSKRK